MVRGRLPKPSALKELDGDPGKRGLPKGEPRPEVCEPEAPGHWREGSEAMREWRRLAPELVRLGMLTRLDRGVLAAYCEAWEALVQADRRLRKVGAYHEDEKGRVTKDPAWVVKAEAVAAIGRLAGHLGISPAARARVVALPVAKDDEFTRWEKGRGEKVVPFRVG